jgi:hypothetical protein
MPPCCAVNRDERRAPRIPPDDATNGDSSWRKYAPSSIPVPRTSSPPGPSSCGDWRVRRPISATERISATPPSSRPPRATRSTRRRPSCRSRPLGHPGRSNHLKWTWIVPLDYRFPISDVYPVPFSNCATFMWNHFANNALQVRHSLMKYQRCRAICALVSMVYLLVPFSE